MNSRDFCYWLQGLFELRESKEPLTVRQTDLIEKHLHMVFEHEIDPSFEDREELEAIHNPESSSEPVEVPKGVTITVALLAARLKVKPTELLMALLGEGLTGVHIQTMLTQDIVDKMTLHFKRQAFIDQEVRNQHRTSSWSSRKIMC